MRHCEHIKPDGEFCGAPALRGRDYCHWHLTCVARRLRAEKQEATQDHTPLQLPPLEDANSIQVSLMMVIDAMLRNRISPKMSGQPLYALQIASSNLNQGVDFRPGKKVQCNQYDRLEEDFDIAEHAAELKTTELPPPMRHADVCMGSPDDPWIDRFGAVHDPATEPQEPNWKTEEYLSDTLLAASQTDDPQCRRDLVLSYLQCAPEAPRKRGAPPPARRFCSECTSRRPRGRGEGSSRIDAPRPEMGIPTMSRGKGC